MKKIVIAAAGAFLVLAVWLGSSTVHAEGRCRPGVVSQSCPPPPLDVSKVPAPPPPPDPAATVRVTSDGQIVTNGPTTTLVGNAPG